MSGWRGATCRSPRAPSVKADEEFSLLQAFPIHVSGKRFISPPQQKKKKKKKKRRCFKSHPLTWNSNFFLQVGVQSVKLNGCRANWKRGTLILLEEKEEKKKEGVGGIGSKGSLGVANVEVKREPCNWNWAALFSDMLMKLKLASNQVGSFEKWQNACTANMKPVKTKFPLTKLCDQTGGILWQDAL